MALDHKQVTRPVWHGWGSVSDSVARWLGSERAEQEERRALDDEFSEQEHGQ